MLTSEFMERNHALLVSHWLTEARSLDVPAGVHDAELLDDVPGILSWLAHGGPPDALRAHLLARRRGGFTLRQVVGEFVLLGRVLQLCAAEAVPPPDAAQMAVLLEQVGGCIDHALRCFEHPGGCG